MQIVKLQEMMQQQERIRSQVGESADGELNAIEESYRVIIGKYESILGQIQDRKLEGQNDSLFKQLGIGVKIENIDQLENKTST